MDANAADKVAVVVRTGDGDIATEEERLRQGWGSTSNAELKADLEHLHADGGHGAGDDASYGLPPTWWLNTVMLTGGMATLWFWFTIINVTDPINERYFPNEGYLTNVVTVTYEIANLAAVLVCVCIDILNPKFAPGLMYTSLILAVVCPFVLLFKTTKVRVCAWIIMTALFGLWTGVSQTFYFGLAANMPDRSKTAMVSSGQGIGGVACFGIYLLLFKAFKCTAFVGMIIQMAMLIFLTFVGVLGMWRVRIRPSVQKHITEQKLAVARVCEAGGKLSLLAIAKKGWLPLANVVCTFFMSYLVFPNTGPERWHLNGGSTQSGIVSGCSSVGVMLGRSAPMIAALFLTIKTTTIVNCLRIFWPIMFVITAVKSEVHVFGEWWYQALLAFTLSLSEGWMGTLGLVHSANAGGNIYETSILSTMSVIAVSIGLCVSLGLAPALQAAVGI